MNKELYVSSTPHETRLALAEDGEIAEVYFEREKEYSLAGAIYKGRVTRVLPGMQSAFIDIGLERDAFLYVSDFFEDSDEYDRVVSEAENAVEKLERPPARAPRAGAADEPGVEPTEAAPSSSQERAPEPASEGERAERSEDRRRSGRHRGRRGRGGIPDAKFARPPAPRTAESEAAAAPDELELIAPPPAAPSHAAPHAAPDAAAAYAAMVLPGESLAKYRGAPAPPVEARPPATHAGAPGATRWGTNGSDPAKSDEPSRASSAPEPPPPAFPAASAAYAPFVLPGESLGKYRDLAPATPDDAGPEAERQVFEHERIQPDSPAHAPVAVDAAELAAKPASDNAYDEADSDASDDTIDGDVAGEAEAGEESEEASAAVRADSGEARLQAPAPREDRDGREGRRGRHRRRRRGGQRGPAAAPAAGAEAGESADAVEAAARPAPPARRSEGKNESSRLIGDLLHPGQEILIQIAKEPLGKKGARITSHLALPGRYLVYMPTVSHIGVSRKISSDEERARLKRLILENSQDLPGGFIVRTAGAAATDEEFKADIRLLANQWKDMRQQFDQVRGPALLHHDLSLVERTLRDQLSNEFSHIWVDTDEQYQRIVKFVGYFMPHLVDRVRLYTRDEPMFEHFGIQEEINKGLKSKVWLKSGGYIVINQTEALVAIDVNTGKYVGKSNRLEDTIVKTNVDAIKEIVRQIRLRDLGGIIVIDFIDMDERRNRQRVMQALDEAMRADRAPSKVLAFNDFGLVALTRKRVKQSLERTLGSACPYCEGVGLVKSATTVCNEIYAEVRKTAPTIDREDVVLRVNPEIAKALKGQGGQRLREMEDLTRKAISVRPDPLVHQEQFEIY